MATGHSQNAIPSVQTAVSRGARFFEFETYIHKLKKKCIIKSPWGGGQGLSGNFPLGIKVYFVKCSINESLVNFDLAMVGNFDQKNKSSL